MGKSLLSVKMTTPNLNNNPRNHKPKSQNRIFKPETSKSGAFGGGGGGDAERFKLKMENQPVLHARLPLSEVVSDCVNRWFQDTLEEAEAGDCAMQLLVAQMYYNGYGVPKDAQKGKTWFARASRRRNSDSTVGQKHPGYNASDSDSDELKNDSE